ncbi:AAA family ATPase [Rhodococcus opacus]|nr:AAA family ATPase [Rhodococcus opacus]
MEAPPPRLPLVGRTEDVAAICALFGDPAVGMLTVVGQAGVGKTTVVAAVAERLTASGIDVSWVDLSECASGRDGLAMIEAACARSSASETARVIVVDSLERIGAEVRALGAMAVAHPNVALLATSRAATGLFREYRYRLDPLPYPPLEGPVPADGGRGSALQLFLDHARRVAFETDLESNTPTVAAICRRLDGSPLALLIAANQLSTVTLEGLRGRLESGGSPSMRGPSDLPDRHHTLARTLADSVTLLAPDDAELIQVLALFDGVIEPAAVVEVLTEAAEIEGACGDTFTPDTVVEHLGELVHHTLLHPVHDRSSGKSITFAMTHIVATTGVTCCTLIPVSRVFGPHTPNISGGESSRAPIWSDPTPTPGCPHRRGFRRHPLRPTVLLGIGDARALAVAAGMRNYWLARGLLQEGVEWLTDSIATASDHRTVAMVRALEARAVLTGAASSYASVLDDLSECVDRWRNSANRWPAPVPWSTSPPPSTR